MKLLPAFGISTHLFHEQRLTREHLVHIAAHGFDAVEVFASRSHFDYHDPEAIAQLREWLSDTRLQLHSIHAPVTEGIRNGRWVGSFSNASGDDARRKAAIAETEAALRVAGQIPYGYLVVHLGMPSAEQLPAPLDSARGALNVSKGGDNQAAAARRSVEEIVDLARAVNVRVALEVIPNPLSSAAALVTLIEEDLDGIDAGICLDYGHAHMMGDLGEAIELVGGHLLTTHVHDNNGRRDDHLLPFGGNINWDTAIVETQKIGYDGVMMLEVGDGGGDPVEVLKKSVKARERLEKTFVTF
jgi:sugar phosphate isomerase/epimerase